MAGASSPSETRAPNDTAARSRIVRAARKGRHLVAGAAFAVALAASCIGATAGPGCAPAGHFVLAGAEFTDTTTRLTWQRCGHGPTWSEDGRCDGAARPLNYREAVEAARKAGPPWRLPTADELLALLDESCSDPVADPAVMPDIPLDPSGEPSLYWSSSEAGFEDMMVTVDFRYGFADMHSKGLGFFLRLVRPAN